MIPERVPGSSRCRLQLVARFESRTWALVLEPGRELTFGSSPRNDFALPAPGVSRRHGAVLQTGDGAVVRDHGSKNGLVVAGERRAEVRLRPGETLRVGKATISVEPLAESDAILALALGDAARPSERPATGAATATVRPESAPAAAVLRLARELTRRERTGRARPAAGLLPRARALLEAEGLAFYRVTRRGELVLTQCCGAMIAEALAALAVPAATARKAAARCDILALPGGDHRLAVAGGRSRGSRGACALAAAGSGSWDPGDWKAELLLLLAECRSEPEEMPPPGEPASSEPPPLPPGMVVGGSAAMARAVDQAMRFAGSASDILILGETGTGKELFARLIHANSPQPDGPLVAVNCSAIPAEQLEAELFGIAGRAATGVDARRGRFLQADRGTLLLDEIGDLPLAMQGKLLRALQEREVLPIGAPAPQRFSARVIAATNQNLHALVAGERFRADLYYRLQALELRLPPLRERPADIPELALAFLTAAAREHRNPVIGMSDRALTILLAHPWPGNVRELRNVVFRAVLDCPEGTSVQSGHLPALVPPAPPPAAPTAPPQLADHDADPSTAAQPLTLQEQTDQLERDAIARTLAANRGNRSQAARLLGLSRHGLRLKARRLGLPL